MVQADDPAWLGLFGIDTARFDNGTASVTGRWGITMWKNDRGRSLGWQSVTQTDASFCYKIKLRLAHDPLTESPAVTVYLDIVALCAEKMMRRVVEWHCAPATPQVKTSKHPSELIQVAV